jgi:hypothetical protein
VLRASLTAFIATTLVAVLTGTSAPAPAADPDYPTIAVSDSTVTLGKPVLVTGEGPGLRRLFLQLKTKENGWQKVGSALTGAEGSDTFLAPGWEGTHRLRVLVPGTLVTSAEVSATVTVTVRMPYRPKGPRSDWAWLFRPGARWDPCQPITYRINAAGSYSKAISDTRRTFASVGRVTGFRFKYLGRTDARVERTRHDYHPAGTDVVVDWQSPRQESGLSGRVAGIGGHWVQGNRRFSGYMLLDQTASFPRVVWRQVMSHELGHVLGLGHASSRRQLMYGTSTTANRLWGNGDLTALRRIGASRGCLEEASAPAAARTAPVRVDES